MKTTEKTELKSDPVMSELRLAKETLARRHNFDVGAMVRSLQKREEQELTGQPADPTETLPANSSPISNPQ